jgi:uncharacterized protein with GYD domain
MIFISLVKFRRKPTKSFPDDSNKILASMAKAGFQPVSMYWTLGRYDAVLIAEAPSEKVAMQAMLKYADFVASETLVAAPREEAVKLLE